VALIASAAVLLSTATVVEAQGRLYARAVEAPVSIAAVPRPGAIHGTVVDERGAPVSGATVSALGATSAFDVTDTRGRFSFGELPAGAYVLRAQSSGFVASRRELVDLRPRTRVNRAIQLRRATSSAAVGAPAAFDGQPIEPDGAASAPEAGEEAVPDHPHDASSWRLRHVPRSVLRDASAVPGLAEFGDEDGLSSLLPATISVLGQAMESSARSASNLFGDLPVTGSVNLLATGAFDRTHDLFSSGGLARGVAFVEVSAPAGRDADWTMRAAMRQGDLSSWIVAGAYATQVPTDHTLDVSLSYAAQRYGDGNAAALPAPEDSSRNVGTVTIFDRWIPAPGATILYGGRLAWYDYVDRNALFSPRLALTLEPGERTRVRFGFTQRMVAPGAEEFVPPVDSAVWLPPERTFAPLAGNTFRPERARHVDLGLEHELAGFNLAVRRFHERIDDQLVTLFGLRVPGEPTPDLGHYYVAEAGSVDASGWGLSVEHRAAGRWHAILDYSVANTRWRRGGAVDLLAAWVPSVVRPEYERLHDFTASAETQIPETATRVFVLYKLNNGYAASSPQEGRVVDARFDVRIHQGLPFVRLVNTQWEVLVAVRNLFHELSEGGSLYDELLVVRPPKRIVGGLLVRF
jgi:hypothetical protein